LDITALSLMYNYLNNRKQKVKVGNHYSNLRNVEMGVPQGSILGPLLFNIHIADLFQFLPTSNIVSFADDNTPYVTHIDIHQGVKDLEMISITLFDWFTNNYMKANPEKCNLLASRLENINAIIDGNLIEGSKSEKLLGIQLDCNLTFNEHVENLCKKASQKLSALARISSFIDESKRRVLFKAFIVSQFSYCPLVWMFHSRALNNKINRIHERALRIVYQDKINSFEDLLKKDNSVTIHQRNLQVLVTEIFKVKLGIAPTIIAELFSSRNNHYSLRNPSDFDRIAIKSVRFGENSLSYFGPLIWDQVPMKFKLFDSLNEFKKAIKNFIFENCPCRLCKNYIQGVGFI